MHFHLVNQHLGPEEPILISEESYAKLKSAKQTIDLIGALSENYLVVLESYKAVESILHSTSIDHAIYRHPSYLKLMQMRIGMITPIIGYLSATRFYLDSTSRSIKALIATDKINSYKSFINKIYDNDKNYAFAEALRNYVQHRDTPFDSISFDNRSMMETNQDAIKLIALFISIESIKRDGHFKKSVIDRFDGVDKVNIIDCLRAHVKGIRSGHIYLTKILNKHWDEARLGIKSAIDLLSKELDDEQSFADVICRSDEGEIFDKFGIHLEWDKVRRAAIRGNHGFL